MFILNAGERLEVGGELVSNNGLYRLVMQADGNLVMYAGQPSVANAVWATQTVSTSPLTKPVHAEMQNDGNFVLTTAVGLPVWASGTAESPGAGLLLQDDRNLVIYGPDNRALWATMTDVPSTPLGTGSITTVNNQTVGWGKTMESAATLYRDGRLVVDSYTKNDNWIGGLRGRTLVVVVDGQGRSIWLSQIFEDPTRCSVPDVSCASNGRVTHIEKFPDAVGRYADRLDVFHADAASFVDLRARLIDFIKATVDVAQEIKNAWDQLQK